MNQKEIVFEIIVRVLGNKYDSKKPMLEHFGFTPGKRNKITNGEINHRLVKAIKLLDDEMKKGHFKIPQSFQNKKLIYFRRMIYNWLTRDKRLNGHLNNTERVKQNYRGFGQKLIKKIAYEPKLLKELKAIAGSDKKISPNHVMRIVEIILDSTLDDESSKDQ